MNFVDSRSLQYRMRPTLKCITVGEGEAHPGDIDNYRVVIAGREILCTKICLNSHGRALLTDIHVIRGNPRYNFNFVD